MGYFITESAIRSYATSFFTWTSTATPLSRLGELLRLSRNAGRSISLTFDFVNSVACKTVEPSSTRAGRGVGSKKVEDGRRINFNQDRYCLMASCPVPIRRKALRQSRHELHRGRKSSIVR